MTLSPVEVIKALRQSDEYIPLIYMNGGCWKFYEFLKSVFPEAKPFKVATSSGGDFDHIITKIGAGFFDITGEVRKENYKECKPVEENEKHIYEEWSFSKNNAIFKRCPHCGEEVIIEPTGETSKIEYL